VRLGVGLRTAGGAYHEAGDEFVVRYADAATLLKDKGTRHFEILEDFETDSEGHWCPTPPNATAPDKLFADAGFAGVGR
jgi:hypothetical protein